MICKGNAEPSNFKLGSLQISKICKGLVSLWENWKPYSTSGSKTAGSGTLSYTFDIPSNIRVTSVTSTYTGRSSSAGTPNGTAWITCNGTQVARKNENGYASVTYTPSEPLTSGTIICYANGQGMGWSDSVKLSWSIVGEQKGS